MSTITSTVTLNDGTKMPQFGLGVYLTHGQSGVQAIQTALDFGYRHIDTAQFYNNEEEVGRAVKGSSIPRDQIWITTKIWDSNQGYEQTKKSLQQSLRELQMDYADLVLLHSPSPGSNKRLASWKALEEARDSGLVRSIGVSNYGNQHLQEMIDNKVRYMPSVNQIEVSPFFQRQHIVKRCKELGIHVQAYSPLGKGAHVNDPKLTKLGQKYNKTASQMLIKWSLQSGFTVIPKSSNPDRIKENASIFDFTISPEDMQTMNAMETGSGVTWDRTCTTWRSTLTCSDRVPVKGKHRHSACLIRAHRDLYQMLNYSQRCDS